MKFLVFGSLAILLACSGCDLGTYEKRSQEPFSAKQQSAAPAAETAESGDSESAE